MPIFKTFSEIIDTPWQHGQELNAIGSNPPDNSQWHYIREITIEDVNVWEQIYYKGGHIGIYVSWDPYAEFYMIVYNLFIDTPLGIKTFYGPNARFQIEEEAEKLGISLTKNKIWVDEINLWQYNDSSPS
jgi:hypothetical protein